MLYTAVIIVLPLGTLVAQRIADPGAFNSELSAGSTLPGHTPDRYNTLGASGKKPLLPTWSQSDDDSTVFSGRSGGGKGGAGKTGVTSTVLSTRHYSENGGPMGLADLELARIDGDIEMGRVRVDREIKRSEEMVY